MQNGIKEALVFAGFAILLAGLSHPELSQLWKGIMVAIAGLLVLGGLLGDFLVWRKPRRKQAD